MLRKLIFSYRNKERDIDKVLKFHFKLDHLWIGSDNYSSSITKNKFKKHFMKLNLEMVLIRKLLINIEEL